MPNEADIVNAARSILEQSREAYLCETCWAFVTDGQHVCDPEERARAIAAVVHPTFHDPRRRARGYGVSS